MSEIIARREFFSAMERALAEELADCGYSVIKHDSQMWAACYSLFREDTDGSVTLFFGPLQESGQNWELSYEIVHEGASSENEMSIPKGMGTESSAGLFLQHISDALTNKLPIGNREKPGAERAPTGNLVPCFCQVDPLTFTNSTSCSFISNRCLAAPTRAQRYQHRYVPNTLFGNFL